MDISKLPKLSNSPAPPNNDEPPAGAIPPPPEPCKPVHSPLTVAAEAWISIGLGLLLLWFFPNTLKYLSSKLFGTTFAPFANPTRPFPARCNFILYTDGTQIFYRDLITFWSDAAITAFALVLILDGIVLAWIRRPAVLMLTFCLTVAAVLGNLFYLIKTFDQGLPIVSALAVIIGGYIAMTQWARLQTLRG